MSPKKMDHYTQIKNSLSNILQQYSKIMLYIFFLKIKVLLTKTALFDYYFVPILVLSQLFL